MWLVATVTVAVGFKGTENSNSDNHSTTGTIHVLNAEYAEWMSSGASTPL
jgi:hypothetical protein